MNKRYQALIKNGCFESAGEKASRDALITQIVDYYGEPDWDFKSEHIDAVIVYEDDSERVYTPHELDDFQNTVDYELLEARSEYESDE